MDRGTLSFAKNGVDLGVAFEGLTGELYPAVAFYNQGQRVSLVRTSFSCPGAGVTIPHSPASVGVGEVIELSDLMGAMLARQPLPAALAREAHAGLLAWQAGTTFRCNTLCGYQLQLDTSAEACRPFGFRSGDRVRTPRGNATMMGVADGKPWFQVDGEPGAWFFSMLAVREGRAKGLFTPTSSALRPSSRLVDETDGGGLDGDARKDEQRGKQTAAVATDAVKKGNDGAAALSLAAFVELCDCPRWTAAMDAVLVRAVNEFCYRKNLSPWNLTTRVILACAASVRSELMVLAREADHAAVGGTPLWTSDEAGKDVDRLSDAAVLCRFAVLRLFNDRFAHALAFVGCGDGLPSAAGPAPMLAVWGLPAAQAEALSVGDHPRKFVKPAMLLSKGGGRGLGPMLCALRGSVFTATKERVLRAVIDRTTTSTKKADDDYDYPDDLPQVTVNRPKAIAARVRRDPEARLAMSLFGQLFSELHFLSLSQLRMGYSHPMDDGQQRTFKVRFEGEGVDDYGGPYREIFTQVRKTTAISTCRNRLTWQVVPLGANVRWLPCACVVLAGLRRAAGGLPGGPARVRAAPAAADGQRRRGGRDVRLVPADPPAEPLAPRRPGDVRLPGPAAGHRAAQPRLHAHALPPGALEGPGGRAAAGGGPCRRGQGRLQLRVQDQAVALGRLGKGRQPEPRQAGRGGGRPARADAGAGGAHVEREA
jgi:hypothetical protein